MTNSDPARDRKAAMLAEYAAEEAEAARIEAGSQPDQTVISVRVPTSFAHTLKSLAAAEHLATSTYVRRLIMQAVDIPSAPLTEARVEEIAARVVRQLHAA